MLSKKQKDLQSAVEKLGLPCEDLRKNASLRSTIWGKYSNDGSLDLKETDLAVSAKDGDIKALWERLQNYMPCYSLFQADRKNTDNDDEIQDPLKTAVKQILSDTALLQSLDEVATKVREKLQNVSDLTLKKIKEMNPEIADSLHPKVPSVQELKWADVFKGLSITGDEDIPINKRGSGIKRLILLNFFRAEAERRQKESSSQSIIYAIEEPETSQHKDHQRLLIKALKELSTNSSTQVIITTHSSDIVKQLGFEQIQIVCHQGGVKTIKSTERNSLPYPSLNEVNYIAFGDVGEVDFFRVRQLMRMRRMKKKKTLRLGLQLKVVNKINSGLRSRAVSHSKHSNVLLRHISGIPYIILRILRTPNIVLPN